MERRLVLMACLVSLLPCLPTQAQDPASVRSTAASLYEQSVRLRANWKSEDEYRRGVDLAWQARKTDPTFEPAVLDRCRDQVYNRSQSIAGVLDWADQLRELLKHNPKSTETRFLLAHILLAVDHEKPTEWQYQRETDDLIEQMLRIDPKCGDAHLARAIQASVYGKLDSCLAAVNRALEMSVSERPTAYYVRGGVYQTARFYRAAAEDYSKAAEFIETEVSKLPMARRSSWRRQLRVDLHVSQAVVYDRLGDRKGYDAASSAAVASRRMPIESPESIIEIVRERCSRAANDKNLPWDMFPGSIDGLLQQPKQK